MVTINLFDEVVTPTAASKAMRAVARASSAGVSVPWATVLAILLVWCRRVLAQQKMRPAQDELRPTKTCHLSGTAYRIPPKAATTSC
jgi:hypothetical protein